MLFDPQVFAHAAVLALIAAAAWAFSRGRREHQILALLFAWDCGANVVRLWIEPILDADPGYRGAITRVLYYADHGLVLSFHFAILAACAFQFAALRARTLAVAYVLMFATLVTIKETTGESLLPLHHALAAIGNGVCWLLIIGAVLAPAAALRVPGPVDVALVFMVTGHLVNVCLHYVGPLDETWVAVRNADLVLHAGILAAYVLGLSRERLERWRASQH